jgi:hypothetical protein
VGDRFSSAEEGGTWITEKAQVIRPENNFRTPNFCLLYKAYFAKNYYCELPSVENIIIWRTNAFKDISLELIKTKKLLYCQKRFGENDYYEYH